MNQNYILKNQLESFKKMRSKNYVALRSLLMRYQKKNIKETLEIGSIVYKKGKKHNNWGDVDYYGIVCLIDKYYKEYSIHWFNIPHKRYKFHCCIKASPLRDFLYGDYKKRIDNLGKSIPISIVLDCLGKEFAVDGMGYLLFYSKKRGWHSFNGIKFKLHKPLHEQLSKTIKSLIEILKLNLK